jgi:GNAT superfamily N-acetyltransferase
VPDPLVLRPSRYDQPDAVRLTGVAQTYYTGLYGGGDANPLEPEEFTAPNGLFLIGYLGLEAVAMGGWRLYPGDPPVPAVRAAEIRRMFVVDRLRGRGVGHRLLRELEGSARDTGADVMLLETGRPQVEAVALYRAGGYADVPPFGHYADAAEAIHLGKRLAADGAP